MMTGSGVILGTAAYMSPEQAKGRLADRRSDVWAFGCVLYEMLTGQRAFSGKDATDVIAAIVRAEPDWTALPANAPAPIRRLLRRCLEKDRQRRLADAADADWRSTMRWQLHRSRRSRWRRPGASRRSRSRPWSLARQSLRSSGGFSRGMRRPGRAAVAVWHRAAARAADEESTRPAHLALSPDGRHLVYISTFGAGGGQLAVRDIDQVEPRLIDGVTNAREAFLFHDSRWIGFFDGDELKKVSMTGGRRSRSARSRGLRAARAGTTTTSSCSPERFDHWALACVGDGCRQADGTDDPDPAQHEGDHLYHRCCPAAAVCCSRSRPSAENAQVAVLDLKTGQRKILIRGGSDAKYVDVSNTPPRSETQALARQRISCMFSAGTLRGVGFDLAKLEVLGEPVRSSTTCWSADPVRPTMPSRSRARSSMHRVGPTRKGRRGRSCGSTGRGTKSRSKRRCEHTALRVWRRTVQRIVVDIKDRQNDLWIWDLARQTLTRLTLDDGSYPSGHLTAGASCTHVAHA